MGTYLILNVIVLAVVLITLRRYLIKPLRPWILTFAVLLILTVLFDNILIWLDMYSYATDKILGIRLWLAPIEDFMYPLLATLLVPALWNKLENQHA